MSIITAALDETDPATALENVCSVVSELMPTLIVTVSVVTAITVADVL